MNCLFFLFNWYIRSRLVYDNALVNEEGGRKTDPYGICCAASSSINDSADMGFRTRQVINYPVAA